MADALAPINAASTINAVVNNAALSVASAFTSAPTTENILNVAISPIAAAQQLLYQQNKLAQNAAAANANNTGTPQLPPEVQLILQELFTGTTSLGFNAALTGANDNTQNADTANSRATLNNTFGNALSNTQAGAGLQALFSTQTDPLFSAQLTPQQIAQLYARPGTVPLIW